MNIHISNLSPDTTEEELRKLFSRFGKVKSVNIFKYPNSQSKGYGFIDAPAPADVSNNVKKQMKISSISSSN